MANEECNKKLSTFSIHQRKLKKKYQKIVLLTLKYRKKQQRFPTYYP